MLSPERGPGARPASGPEPENVEDRGPVRTSNASSPLRGPGAQPQGPPTATTPPPPGSRSQSRAGSAGGDHLRVVKHKPSFIVFRDFDADGARRPGRVVRRAESDAGGSSASASASSSATTEEEDCRDDQEKAEEADLIPELSQYEGFPVSRCRRNLATSRKCLRRRRDVPVISSVDPVAAVSADSEEEEEEEGAKNNNDLVRRKMHCLYLLQVYRLNKIDRHCKYVQIILRLYIRNCPKAEVCKVKSLNLQILTLVAVIGPI